MYTIALILFKLTFSEIVADIPHDFPALIIYLVLGLFVAGIWYGSRNKGASAGGDAGHRV